MSERYPLGEELRREIMLQINERLRIRGVISQSLYERAKEKIAAA